MTQTIGIYDFLAWVGDKLKKDADIAAACQELYSKDLTVLVGQDESQLPSDELSPMVIFIPAGRGMTAGNYVKTRGAAVTIGTKGSNDRLMKLDDNEVMIYEDAAKHDVLADLIINKLSELPKHPSGYAVSDVSDGSPDSINFPTFRAFAYLQVQIDSGI